MEYNKLVRDKIPEIIVKNGDDAITHVAKGTEYDDALYAKLVEEVEEFLAEKDTGELADILEVIYAICDLKGVSREQLEQLRQEKENERGGFKEGIILDSTN